MNEEKSPMQIYRSPDGKISLEVQLEKETIWLSQKMMAELFSVEVATINHHISKIYKSLELSQD